MNMSVKRVRWSIQIEKIGSAYIYIHISYISCTYHIHITLVVASRQCLFTYYEPMLVYSQMDHRTSLVNFTSEDEDFLFKKWIVKSLSFICLNALTDYGLVVMLRQVTSWGNGTNNCWFPLARKWPTWKWTWTWIPYGKIENKCPRYFRRDSRGIPRDLNMCRTGRSAALSRGRKSMPPRRESMKLVVQQRKFT